MRILIAMALCATLAGCVTAEEPDPIPVGVNPEHDAHCRSLMMAPGSLVYIQCRLAMSETQRNAEDKARRLLQEQLGTLPEDGEAALRDDVFCNYNESTKRSVEFGEAANLAFAANAQCTATRRRLEQALLEWYPGQAGIALATYDRDTIATNQATIEEARAVR